MDRTQRGLPIHRGRCGTLTADYKRNGTTTLFAAIDMAEGKLIGTCMAKHRHQEWIKFLRQIDEETPSDLDLHVIVDNYATHKHPRVKSWLKRHPRFHQHFIPTSSSWLNVIERWFREITQKRLRRGTFRNVSELIEAIQSFIAAHNTNPRPFTWTAKADEILAKIERAVPPAAEPQEERPYARRASRAYGTRIAKVAEATPGSDEHWQSQWHTAKRKPLTPTPLRAPTEGWSGERGEKDPSPPGTTSVVAPEEWTRLARPHTARTAVAQTPSPLPSPEGRGEKKSPHPYPLPKGEGSELSNPPWKTACAAAKST